MRGQDALSRLRMEGCRPALVWLTVLDEPCCRATFLDAENTLAWGDFPEVHVGSDDRIASLDFRPLVGTTVLLQGTDRARLREVWKHLRSFAPARVIASDGDFFHDTEDA